MIYDSLRITRRHLLKVTAGALGAAAVGPYVVPASALGAEDRPAPSNRVTIGCIGLGGRGTVDMHEFLGRDRAQVVALCDVDAGSTRYEDAWHRGLAPARETVEKH